MILKNSMMLPGASLVSRPIQLKRERFVSTYNGKQFTQDEWSLAISGQFVQTLEQLETGSGNALKLDPQTGEMIVSRYTYYDKNGMPGEEGQAYRNALSVQGKCMLTCQTNPQTKKKFMQCMPLGPNVPNALLPAQATQGHAQQRHYAGSPDAEEIKRRSIERQVAAKIASDIVCAFVAKSNEMQIVDIYSQFEPIMQKVDHLLQYGVENPDNQGHNVQELNIDPQQLAEDDIPF